MTITARIADTAAALTTEIAALAGDHSVELDLRDGDAGSRLLRCLPWHGDSWDAPVAMDTHAMRDLYRAIMSDRTMCADLRRMAVSNANDERDSDGKRHCDMNGSYASVAHVLGLCMALAQWDRNEADYAAECESWGERYAEAGSDYVHGGGNSLDAGLVAAQVAGPKPTRWWVHAA
jgi:hypothetical protein